MKKIRIVGEVLIQMSQTIEVPDDEVVELVNSRELLITNIDEHEADHRVICWDWIRGDVLP